MMAGKNRLIHTPEGVRDSYNAECRKKLAVQDKILNTLYLYGYEHIQTPSFEYFDIFSKDRGSVSDREMFKFFDRDNNTLVLRPDMTPAVARCVAKYFMDDDMPLRLCYLERTFKNNSSYQGRLKERAGILPFASGPTFKSILPFLLTHSTSFLTIISAGLKFLSFAQ